MHLYHLLKIFVHMQLKLLKTRAISIVKNFLMVLKNFTTDAIKTASKRAIQKTAEATGNLICNKITDKITTISKTFSQNDEANNEMEISKERYISLEKR